VSKLLDLYRAIASEVQLSSRLGRFLGAIAEQIGELASNTEAVATLVTQFAAGEVPITRTLTAGAGLTGGGDLSANRTFDVGQNADSSIIVNGNNIQLNPILQAQLASFVGPSSTQTTWYIDPVNGNDANDGLTPATAIKTDAERQNRVGKLLWVIEADTSITYLNDVPATDPVVLLLLFGKNGILRINGTATVTYTSPGGGFTAVTNLNRGTQTPSSITEAGLGAGRVGQRIRTTSGVNSGAIAFLAKDLGGGSYRTNPWSKMSFTANPIPIVPTVVTVAPGDQFVIESLSAIARMVISIATKDTSGQTFGAQLIFQNFKYTGNDSSNMSTIPGSSAFLSAVAFGCDMGAYGAMSVGGGLNVCGCYVHGAIFYINASVLLSACLVTGRITIQNGSIAILDYDTLFQGSSNNGLRARYNAVVRAGAFAVFDTTGDAILIEDSEMRCAVFNSGADLVWGTGGSAAGIRVNSGGKVTYTTKPTVTGASDTVVGGTPKTYATIPYVEPANNAMIVAFA
jgi:hypothetical protein